MAERLTWALALLVKTLHALSTVQGFWPCRLCTGESAVAALVPPATKTAMHKGAARLVPDNHISFAAFIQVPTIAA